MLNVECRRKEAEKSASLPRQLRAVATSSSRFDLYLHRQRPIRGSLVSATDRRDVGVVAADGVFHVGFVRLAVVGWVQTAPSDSRNEDFHPRVCGAGGLRRQITADVKRGNAQRAAETDHHVREVLADAAALGEGF